jgi:probable addiction module antidote protein
MPVKTRQWDVAEHLDSPDAIAAYLDAAMEDGDVQLITAALGDVARARGMTQLAKDTGLSRESLYRSLSPEGSPEFATVVRVLDAFGVRLRTSTAGQPRCAQRRATTTRKPRSRKPPAPTRARRSHG